MPGVYLSYPFCAQKCTFCNFASGVFPRDLERQYGEALAGDLSAHRWDWRPETVYLGGGTPSQMDLDLLRRLLAPIPGRPWAEATIEAAPGTVTPERVAAWRELGIDRVSLGVQSFVARELARTGRKHTAEIVQREVALLRSAGIQKINIDLIAGLPGQTPTSWRESLDEAARLRPGHVSVYLLEVDEDSRLGNEIILGGTRYGAADTPSDECMAELYEMAVAYLRDIGIYRYEISNFAVPGEESRHNLKYWRLEPYAGFGADAHSFDGQRRSQTAETAREYVERWQRGEPAYKEMVPAHPDEERFFVGLRLREGILLTEEDRTRFGAPIGRFLAEGLLADEDGRLRLTDRGVLLSNEVFQEFVNA
jgi:oxygen-independent coproporphyrinogen-3 oxidase